MEEKIEQQAPSHGFLRKPFIFFVVWIVCSSTACSALGLEKRIKDLRERNPQWDENTVMLLAACQIRRGMTKAMVIASLGEPPWVNRKGREEEWEYVTYLYVADRAIVDYKYYVYFDEEGIVLRTLGDSARLGCPGR